MTFSASQLSLGYGSIDHPIVTKLDFNPPKGKITVLAGPNGCGKSTLLKGLARVLLPQHGAVYLGQQNIASIPTREIAKTVGLLPQQSFVPTGITVRELVARGRFPHTGAFGRWKTEDTQAVDTALHMTHTTKLANKRVDELSGGQQQRVWVAMVFAQNTSILMLDEPTTFLDIANQVDILDVTKQLNQQQHTTIIMVLHDLNMAATYADHLVLMRDGGIVSEGIPSEILTPKLVREVFAIDAHIMTSPVTGKPLVIPISQATARSENQ